MIRDENGEGRWKGAVHPTMKRAPPTETPNGRGREKCRSLFFTLRVFSIHARGAAESGVCMCAFVCEGVKVEVEGGERRELMHAPGSDAKEKHHRASHQYGVDGCSRAPMSEMRSPTLQIVHFVCFISI